MPICGAGIEGQVIPGSYWCGTYTLIGDDNTLMQSRNCVGRQRDQLQNQLAYCKLMQEDLNERFTKKTNELIDRNHQLLDQIAKLKNRGI